MSLTVIINNDDPVFSYYTSKVFQVTQKIVVKADHFRCQSPATIGDTAFFYIILIVVMEINIQVFSKRII